MPTPEVIEKLDSLVTKVNELSEDVKDLTTSNETLAESNGILAASNDNNQRWIKVLGIIGLVVALVVVGVVYALVKVNNATDAANEAIAKSNSNEAAIERANQSRLAACEVGNVERANTRKFLLTIANQEVAAAKEQNIALTEQEKKEIKQFRDLVNKSFPGRDCVAVVNVKPDDEPEPESTPTAIPQSLRLSLTTVQGLVP